MNTADSARFSKAMLGLAEVYGAEISKTRIEIYFEALSEFSIDDIESVVVAAVRTLKFFPKPSELIEMINGKSQDLSLLAWIQVTKAIDSCGAYKSVKFADQAIHSCIEHLGGWVDLCNVPGEEMVWKQKEFERLYVLLSKRQEHSSHLAGIFEISNSANGFINHIPKPILIGFEDVKQIEAARTDGQMPVVR